MAIAKPRASSYPPAMRWDGDLALKPVTHFLVDEEARKRAEFSE